MYEMSLLLLGLIYFPQLEFKKEKKPRKNAKNEHNTVVDQIILFCFEHGFKAYESENKEAFQELVYAKRCRFGFKLEAQ